MPIYSVTGDIFEVGTQIAEVIAPWLRRGFNMRSATWDQFVEAHGDALARARVRGDGLPAISWIRRPLYEGFWREPWQVQMDTLWELGQPVEKCKFLYVFSNPGDPLGCPTVAHVAAMVRSCLDSAAAVGARSVAFIHIPTVQNQDVPNDQDNHLTAGAMVDAASGWLTKLPEDDFNIYLVDRAGDFGTLPGIIPFEPDGVGFNEGRITSRREPTMPPIEVVRMTDDQGRLIVDHDFGVVNARRRVRVTLEPIPPADRFRGSRQHVLDLVSRPYFGTRMQQLVGLPEVEIPDEPHAIPIGHEIPDETAIEDYMEAYCPGVWPEAIRHLDCGRWWIPYGGTRPQMDLICKAQIRGQSGLLFVEAKAHENELDWGGKPLSDGASVDSQRNHANITGQIESASANMNRYLCPGFNLDITSHYQLANRITYLWKLASLGVPTVLLYLGFTGDDYFPYDLLRDDRHWQRIMGGYLQGVVPQGFPDRIIPLRSSQTPLGMLIRSLSLDEIRADRR